MLRQKQQQVDELSSKLNITFKHQLELKHRRLEQAVMRLSAIKPERLIADRSRRREELTFKLKDLSVRNIEKRRARLDQLHARLETLSPFNVLKRGYALLTDHESGHIIHSASIKPGLAVDARVADGIIEMEVKSSCNDAKK